MNVGAVLVTPLRMREDISFMVDKEQQQAVSGPRIVYDDDDVLDEIIYKVVVDNEVLAATKNFMGALCVYLSSFYVFDLVYEKEIKGTLVFFQRVIVGLEDRTPVPSKVSTFTSDIFTFSQTLK